MFNQPQLDKTILQNTKGLTFSEQYYKETNT